MIQVIKRDGRIKDFDKHRITNAISKAFKEVYDSKQIEKSKNITKAICEKIEHLKIDTINIEKIQDIVIEEIKKVDKKVALSYVSYRKAREIKRVQRHYLELQKNILNKNSSLNDNANVDENSFSGREQRLLQHIEKELALESLPKHIADLQKRCILYNHDFDKYVIGQHNCLFPRMKELLHNGFKARQGDVKPVKYFYSASQVIPVILQLQSQEQFGGVGVVDYDSLMQEYVERSLASNLRTVTNILDVHINIPEKITIESAKQLTDKNTFNKTFELLVKEMHQAIQALITNLVTLQSRAGSQVPFSSINLGLNTSDEGRLVTQIFLEELDRGIGKLDRTAIFPVTCYQVKSGVNKYPEDKNYDLFLKAIEVSHRRLYPTFVNCDWSENRNDLPIENMNIMGCVDGDEIITYKFHNQLFVESFSRTWKRLKKYFKVKNQKVKGCYYIDLENVQIYDTKKGFVKVYKIIKNKDMGDWTRIKFSNGGSLLATNNHPLPIIDRGRTLVKDLKIDDKVYANIERDVSNKNEAKYIPISITSIEFLGELNKPSYDVTTESDHFEVSGIYSHNCRTIVAHNINKNNYIKEGRGNLAPVTINLPYLGLKYNKDKDIFFKKLHEILTYAKDSLMTRYNIMKSQSPSVAPFMYGNATIMDGEKCVDNVEPALKNCTLAIGYIGVAECVKAMTGFYHNENIEAQKLGVKIVKTIRDFCDKCKKELKLNFSVYATPAEGLCYKTTKALKKEFGIIEGITDKEYITNSHHVPVQCGENFFKKVDIESEYSTLANGGNIFHIEIDGRNCNIKAMYNMLIYALDKNIPYIRFSHPIATCLDCGYSIGAFMDKCENCGSDNIENLAIVTGYLSVDYKRMNKGKQDEVKNRMLNEI